ncbi:homoserine dehydrogenase [Ferrithrix thermotolerans DSM 19514]|uniref:Homoserine dehydrogenase n=1 Tax=Ferrithrix thermotolerans DSM 19514 TaxID=1121881 RepID=A0A1M4VBD6_9ACTN|nr:homoserine dehydrogenase [Ferrithrix thermotolerans]SHE66217.1 homoserine dehydrogenase [Ferrithrix thermotolerans DSM 19514]
MKIGLLGCGNVGSAFVKILIDNGDSIKERIGENLEISKILVRDLNRERDPWINTELLTTEAESIVGDPEIDIVVEVMGDLNPSKSLIEASLRRGKSVVTANKALLAEHYFEIEELAEQVGRDVFFEAAVAGGIPLIRSLRVSLVGERLSRVTGIVNGTTNFILTRMHEESLAFEEALAMAQRLGYAEADPRADLEGYDAAAKAAILSSIAFGMKVRFQDVLCEGISNLTAKDVEFASRHGFVIKLIAECARVQYENSQRLSVRVFPALLPATHPLSSVRDAFNAIFVEGEAVGELMFYGRGAGGLPTASAVMGDVIDAAQNLHYGSTERRLRRREVKVVPLDALESNFYVAIEVADKPGVLAKVATVFGECGVSIASMEQIGLGEEARLVFLTHSAKERSMVLTLDALAQLDSVRKIHRYLRVIDG